MPVRRGARNRGVCQAFGWMPDSWREKTRRTEAAIISMLPRKLLLSVGVGEWGRGRTLARLQIVSELGEVGEV